MLPPLTVAYVVERPEATLAQVPRRSLVLIVEVTMAMPAPLAAVKFRPVPMLRVIAPRVSVTSPPLPGTTVTVLAPKFTAVPLNVWLLELESLPTTFSRPPPRLNIELPEMMSEVGAPAALKPSVKTPALTAVAPV